MRYVRPVFDPGGDRHGVEHRLTQPRPPWTNGSLERMNRTFREATLTRYHDDSHDPLNAHCQSFLMACHFARRLKTLKGLTPCEYLCMVCTMAHERFTINTTQHSGGLNI